MKLATCRCHGAEFQRLVIRGQRRHFRLGSEIPFSLAQAREMAQANRKLAREGVDPLAEKRGAYGIPSCAVATERLVEQERSGWRKPRHGGDWMARRHAFPRSGRTPVSVVTSDDVLEILGPICIWPAKAPTARVMRRRIRTVLESAVAMEFRAANPRDRVGLVLP